MAVPSLRRVDNPPNRFDPKIVEWLDEPPGISLEVYEERAKSIISQNDSPDVGFGFSVNPYRGCFHGCTYCYARPTHQYLDYGAGTDFERKLIAKVNAPELLEAAFQKRSWAGDGLAFSGVTDCYQPLEAHYELTRRCLEICLKYRNPVAIITKGALIRRDIDLLVKLQSVTRVTVYISLAFSDDRVARLIEPSAPRPSVRLRAIRALSDAGIPVGIGIAPVIPGLTDHDMPEILNRAYEQGARSAFMTLLRLPLEVKDVFLKSIADNFPDRYDKIVNRIRAMKGGALNRSEFGTRMRGDGEEWKVVEYLFQSTVERLGYNRAEPRDPAKENTFRRYSPQLGLFDRQ